MGHRSRPNTRNRCTRNTRTPSTEASPAWRIARRRAARDGTVNLSRTPYSGRREFLMDAIPDWFQHLYESTGLNFSVFYDAYDWDRYLNGLKMTLYPQRHHHPR